MATSQNTIKPFDGNGYSNWEFRVKLLLEHHDVLEILSMDPPTPGSGKMANFKKKDIKG